MNFGQKAVVTFVGVLAVVLALAMVVPLLSGSSADAAADTPPELDVENPQYSADRLILDDTPGEATVEMDSTARNKTILVDTGPGVQERDIRPLVNALTSNGHDVQIRGGDDPPRRPGPPRRGPPGRPAPPGPSGPNEPIAGALEDAHALVTVGGASYTGEDVEAIADFVEDDGRVLLLADPAQSFSTDLSGVALQSELDVYSEPGYFYNLVENDLNHMRVFAEPDAPSALTADVDRLLFAGATPVESETPSDLATVIDDTNLSTTRAGTDAAVVTKEEGVALVGDTDFMSPENAQRADNDAFIGNLADFLVTGDRELGDGEEQNESGGGDNVKTVVVAPGGEPVFEPQFLEIEPGTTVRFEWASGGHNIVITNQEAGGDWQGVPGTQDEGFVHEHTFKKEGAYEFASEPAQEEGMVGVIVVGDPEPPESG